MGEPDYQGFWEALPHVAMLSRRSELQEGFRREHREVVLSLLSMLHRLGLVWGATSLHPSPPGECDLCGAALRDQQLFVEGQAAGELWGNMCASCFLADGHSVGWGKGQLYLNIGDGAWRLVAGGDPATRESE